jgi:hypothetical protein
VLDCPASSVQVIQNAFSGAVEMAFQAATRLQDEGRASQITDLYNALFVDQTVANGRPSISSVASKASIVTNRSKH